MATCWAWYEFQNPQSLLGMSCLSGLIKSVSVVATDVGNLDWIFINGDTTDLYLWQGRQPVCPGVQFYKKFYRNYAFKKYNSLFPAGLFSLWFRPDLFKSVDNGLIGRRRLPSW